MKNGRKWSFAQNSSIGEKLVEVIPHAAFLGDLSTGIVLYLTWSLQKKKSNR